MPSDIHAVYQVRAEWILATSLSATQINLTVPRSSASYKAAYRPHYTPHVLLGCDKLIVAGVALDLPGASGVHSTDIQSTNTIARRLDARNDGKSRGGSWPAPPHQMMESKRWTQHAT